MPTTLKRSQITHTPNISLALERARYRWPKLADRPAALIEQLALLGAEDLPEPISDQPLVFLGSPGANFDLSALEDELANGW
jgi:hypothetical protein